jgi:hypothetical protein
MNTEFGATAGLRYAPEAVQLSSTEGIIVVVVVEVVVTAKKYMTISSIK